MATFNMTQEMAEQYHRATDGGAHPPRTIIGVDYGFDPPISVIAHRCALCSEVLSTDGNASGHALDLLTEDHHAVCTKRPIEVGDYVRWDGDMDDGSNCKRWAEGKVIAFKDSMECRIVQVRLSRSSDEGFAREPYFTGPVLRRIPRPAEAQANALVEMASGALAVRTAHGDIQITADPTLKQGEVAFASPALVDGIDREVCLARWMENRLIVESGIAAPTGWLSPAQIAAGRALWLERFGAVRSAALRAKVADARKVERNRVRVDIQDVE